jgi:plasmid maintenance system antidote protein VapI
VNYSREDDTLMRMQAAYDIAQTRERENQIQVRRIIQRADLAL